MIYKMKDKIADFGRKIKSAREKIGLNQTQFAFRCLGYTQDEQQTAQSKIARYERGVYKFPKIEEVKKICQPYKIKPCAKKPVQISY